MHGNENLTADLIIQYSIVGLILLAALGWILWKLLRKQKNSKGPCCGCALSDSCKKKKI